MRLTRRVSRCRPTPSVQVRSHINRSYHAARNHMSGYRMTSLSVPQLPDTCTWSPLLIRSVRRLCPVTCHNDTHMKAWHRPASCTNTRPHIEWLQDVPYRLHTSRVLRAPTTVRKRTSADIEWLSPASNPRRVIPRASWNDSVPTMQNSTLTTAAPHISITSNVVSSRSICLHICTKCERSHAMH